MSFWTVLKHAIAPHNMPWLISLGYGALGGLGGLVYITAGVSEWKFENGETELYSEDLW